jgi:heat shock protein HslJ
MLVITAVSCSPKLSADNYWSDKKWVLTELKGVPVQLSGSRRDAYIEFMPSERKFSGNGGCNRMNGNYTLDKSKINFGEVASTKMSCDDIAFETAFMETLSKVDHYEVSNNQMLLKDGTKVIMILVVK